MNAINIDPHAVEKCHRLATKVADDLGNMIECRTTDSIERSVLRLLGVEGACSLDIPLVNHVVDHVKERGSLSHGVATWVGRAMHDTGLDAQKIAEAVSRGELDLTKTSESSASVAAELIEKQARQRLRELGRAIAERRSWRAEIGEGTAPLAYVLTATGNVHEDIRHVGAVARAGGDIIALIRSTAQSLLDYVPEGLTTEGYGGTYATQANFRALRAATDEFARQRGSYLQLSSFSSGLCMPEIAVMGVIEGLDNMVNDAMYGILYRDINMTRTLIDQNFSRTVSGHFGIVINTGEDNFLRTVDPMDGAPSVVCSQFINYHLAKRSGMTPNLVAVGNAFEIDPSVPNSLLYEWSHALLTRQLFPECPVKYMPPTKHMNGDGYRTHAADTLFNLVSVATGQAIQTIGVPSEGTYTPHIQDRVIALGGSSYVRTAARDLSRELTFRPDGIIVTRARTVLQQAVEELERVAAEGLESAIERGAFGGVRRKRSEGRGLDGVHLKHKDYFNPFESLLREGAAV